MVVQVKTMSIEDHYEMREYNIDVLKDDRGSSVFSKETPYPIYPSKGGLPAAYISTAIARFVWTTEDTLLQKSGSINYHHVGCM